MWPKSSIADRRRRPVIGALLVVGILGAASAAAQEGGEGPAPPRRGLPLEVEREARLPALEQPPAGPQSTEREAIESLSLNLGPIPREVVLDEDAAAATFKRAASLPETTLGLHLPRGNMIRPGLLARLVDHPAVHLWLEMPLLPVHQQQLEQLSSLRQITLGVDPGEDEAAWVAIERLPPGRVRVWLRGLIDAARVELWSKRRRVQLLLDPGPSGLEPAALEALGPLWGQRVTLWLRPGSLDWAAPVLEQHRPRGILYEPGPEPPPRAFLETQTGPSTHVELLVGPRMQASDLQTLRGLGHLGLTLWLPEVRRKEARRALQLMEKTLGDRKPR